MTKTDLREYSKAMMEEEISDPLELLKSLSAFLNGKGGIAGTNEIIKIVSYMRSCKKLVGRCIYLNILRMTKNEEILKKFMADGGWKVLNKWISEAKETNNEPILGEILKLLHRLPVTLQHLRENNTPKIVKHFAKSQNQKLRSTASLIMQSWMAVITGNTTVPETEPPKKKKKEKKKVKAEASVKSSPKPEANISPPVMKAPSFAKFRKTGLETEQTLPKKKAGQPIRKRNSTESDSKIPDKKIKQDTKPQKKIMISEGEGFMDALNSASNPLPIPVKKVKRRPVKPAATTPSASTKTQTSTEVTTGDANDFSATELLRRLSPKQGSSSPVSSEPPKPRLNKYGKPMKTVRFKSDELLESIRYFEIDENERVNVSTQNFKDAQHREMMIERQLMKGGKIPGENSGDGEWQRPALIEGLEILAAPGCNSVEKDIQTEREKTVLMSIFLSKEMVPDTPTEPDPEPYEIIQPKIIPFEDESAVAESLEPEQDNGSSANDVIMKNMLSGMQAKDGNDLTVKLRQILETASAMQASNNGENGQQQPQIPTTMSQVPHQQQPSEQPMVWEGSMPSGDPNMMMMDGQMQYFPGQPMMVPDPNFYPPNWNPAMGPPRPMFDQNWGARPPWRGERPMVPPHARNGFRGHNDNWRGRWNNGRR